jgi:hypothetical protein
VNVPTAAINPSDLEGDCLAAYFRWPNHLEPQPAKHAGDRALAATKTHQRLRCGAYKSVGSTGNRLAVVSAAAMLQKISSRGTPSVALQELLAPECITLRNRRFDGPRVRSRRANHNLLNAPKA